DSYVVHPWRFPGGDVGKLAVCGTVNDLAVMGAQPRYLSAGLIIEEGTAQADLLAAVESMARAAEEAGVLIVTGDTKVVERGKGDGIFVNTAGIGIKPAGRDIGGHRLAPGQALIVSGNLGDHSVAVMLSREGMEFESDIVSDCAPLNGLVEALIEAAGAENIFAIRDLTRGGLAAVLNEYAATGGLDMLIEEAALPVLPAVRAAARVLGFEPSVLANEGKLLAVVAKEQAEVALAALKSHPYGCDAALIGVTGSRFNPAHPAADRPRRPLVLYTTPSGGRRVVEMPLGELLPRIC
ncbi:hydrogenase expression/formation protein HypE, partial [bacterium]|nr:hydrogenase expression/formation protein HypE [bacterium]